MKMTELFLAELDREAVGTRSTLQRVPEGHNNWKPHERSMPLGYLAALVAKMPSWIAMVVTQDEMDFAARKESSFNTSAQATKRELLQLLEGSIAEGRVALQNTTDEHLLKPWRFRVGERIVNEDPRHVVIRDAVFNHGTADGLPAIDRRFGAGHL
jgi:hypothetical protein